MGIAAMPLIKYVVIKIITTKKAGKGELDTFFL